MNPYKYLGYSIICILSAMFLACVFGLFDDEIETYKKIVLVFCMAAILFLKVLVFRLIKLSE